MPYGLVATKKKFPSMLKEKYQIPPIKGMELPNFIKTVGKASL